MHGRTQWKIMLLSHTLTMIGIDVASLVEFSPVVYEDGRTTNARTDAIKNNVAFAHPYHDRNWCSKFGWIQPSGLWGWTDDGRTQWKILLLSHYLTMRGSDVAGLDEFQPVVKEITWPTDGRTTDGRTDARKNNVALAPPLHEGKWCSKFVWISPTGLGGEHDGRTDRRWRSQYPHSLKKKKKKKKKKKNWR